ncbi:DUF2795 domain-containing protein [Nocardiopsis algeriensis]|uniref:DUF2795 domain-containing protein n=1 Tax=Nocardiopsis algeriensis TaxID=1478215 RepID=A0A841IVS3_9ACTN|nr:hypothetical protein [Nocardiopsis algeriensis]
MAKSKGKSKGKAKINPVELQRAIKGAAYPAEREDLVSTAKNNGAHNDLVDRLAGVKVIQFDGPDDVRKAVFGK